MQRAGAKQVTARFARAFPARLVATLTALMFSACGEARRDLVVPPLAPTSPRIDVFLSARTQGAQSLQLELDAVELVAAGRERVSLTPARTSVSSSEVRARMPLAGGDVDPGGYDALAVVVAAAHVLEGGRTRELRLLSDALVEPDPDGLPDGPDESTAAGSVEYLVPLDLAIGPRDATSIFLEWDVEASLVDADGFRLVVGVGFERRQTRLGLLYVADPSSGVVLAVDRGSGEVVSTARVGAGPRALTTSRDRRRMIVANAGDGSVSILDLVRDQVELSVPLRASARPADLALVDRERLVACANEGMDTVAFIDTRTGVRISDVRVGRAPVRLAASPQRRRLFAANALTDDVSVLDTSTRAVVASIPVRSSPSCLAVDRRERELYVGHRLSPDLLVIDVETLSVLQTVFVGDGMTAVLADRLRDRVYVARSFPAELVVVDRRLGVAVERFPIAAPVSNLAQPPEGSLVYGAAPTRGGLIAMDVVLGREDSFLPCGGAPEDVVAID